MKFRSARLDSVESISIQFSVLDDAYRNSYLDPAGRLRQPTARYLQFVSHHAQPPHLGAREEDSDTASFLDGMLQFLRRSEECAAASLTLDASHAPAKLRA